MLNSASVQNRLLKNITILLTQRLGTKVEVDSIYLGLSTQHLHLYGLDIADQQQRPLLHVDTLTTNLSLWTLFRHPNRPHLEITYASIAGLNANLCTDSVSGRANFQFLIDSLKPKKKHHTERLTFQMERCQLRRIAVSYLNQPKNHFQHLLADTINYQLKRQQHQLTLGGITYLTDNHKPHKRTGHPHRGYFDPGHLHLKASLRLLCDHLDKDSLHVTLQKFHACDSTSGIDIHDLRMQVAATKSHIRLSDVDIRLPHTTLNIPQADILPPQPADSLPLRYSTDTITGQTLLTDIAQPFAPILNKFTTPLHLSLRLSGQGDEMRFHDINVHTPDNRLNLKADGTLHNLLAARQLNLHFHVHPMHATNNVTRQIINHFPVKKFMMQQLKALGNITYNGDIHIAWRKETFGGRLHTRIGSLAFNFQLDENTKILTGNLKTDSVNLVPLTNLEHLGTTACQSRFTFDYSKERTAAIRRQMGGKLPIGHVEAEIQKTKYKGIKIQNIHADIQSNGAIAQGNITLKGKRIDLLCAFTFTDTDSIQRLKYKPGIKLHKLSEEAKQEKAKRKQERRDKKSKKSQ